MVDKKIQDIFASRQNSKILTAELSAVENFKRNLKDNDSGESKEVKILCGVVFYGDIKVYIPIDLMNVTREDAKVLRSMIGATVDFIVIRLDEKNKEAFASRRKAMEVRRNIELSKHKEGDTIPVRITGVGLNKIIAEAYGVEVYIRKKEADWGFIPDLNTIVHVGDIKRALITKLDFEQVNKLCIENGTDSEPSENLTEVENEENSLIDKMDGVFELSLRQAKSDPYVENIKKISRGNEYECVITGITNYGIFFKIKNIEGISVLCSYPKWTNYYPQLNDICCVLISRIRPEEKKVDGRLVRLIKHQDSVY